jgi:hypothetical protein
MLLHEPQDILRGNWVAFMGLPPVLAQRFPVACFIVGVGMQRLSPLKEAVNFSVGENPPHDTGPALEASQCLFSGWPSRIDPRLNE